MWIYMLIASAIMLLGKRLVERQTIRWALLSIAYTISIHITAILLLVNVIRRLVDLFGG